MFDSIKESFKTLKILLNKDFNINENFDINETTKTIINKDNFQYNQIEESSVKMDWEEIGPNSNSFDSSKAVQELIEFTKDPVAQKIEWTPLKKWWVPYRNYILQEKDLWKLIFEPSFIKKIAPMMLIILWLIYFPYNDIYFSFIINKNINILIEKGNYITILLSVFLILIWLYKLYNLKLLVFDKQLGYYYKKNIKDFWFMNHMNDENSVFLKNVYAIQIIDEFINNKNPFYSYELNLVMKDYTRINVIDHGDLINLKKDAKQLSEYLHVPLWDMTYFKN